ncbi:MAG: WD40/YVTN/BNR-like repeat-containing protein [Sandaracinaceae bacterium]
MLRLSSAALALAIMLALPGAAFAHGRPPFVGNLQFHPSDPNVLVAQATWGFVLSEDGGESWQWLCAASAYVDPVREDPPFAIMPDGAMLVGSFAGLTRSTPERCMFTFPDEALRDVYIIDVLRDPTTPTTAWAVLTDGAGPDSLWRTTDSGETFAQVGENIEEILLERVRVAPSDSQRVYLSGAIPISMTDGMRQAFVLRSSNGGATFERTQIPLLDGERNLHVLAVDPRSPDRVFVRVLRRLTDDRAERLLLSEDGGVTFEAVSEYGSNEDGPIAGLRVISDVTFSADGTQVFATSAKLDGLFRSDDAGATFQQVEGGNLLCVEAREGELWLCGDELKDGWSLAQSEDAGETRETQLVFSQVGDLVACPACSEVGYICPEWFPDLAQDLGLDAGAGGVDGGVTGLPRTVEPPETCDGAVARVDAGPPPSDAGGMDAGSGVPDAGTVEMPMDGCTCHAAPSRRGSAGAIALLAVGLFLWRRRPVDAA